VRDRIPQLEKFVWLRDCVGSICAKTSPGEARRIGELRAEFQDSQQEKARQWAPELALLSIRRVDFGLPRHSDRVTASAFARSWHVKRGAINLANRKWRVMAQVSLAEVAAG
jgi:hypothetical protein